MKDSSFNKKNLGFTLLELIVVVLIISGLFSVVFAAISSYFNLGKVKYDEGILEQVELAAKSFYSENTDLLPIKKGGYDIVTLKELSSLSYLKNEVVDSHSNSCAEDSYAIVKKNEDGSFYYNVCLFCGDKSYSKDFSKCNITSTDELSCEVSGIDFNVIVDINASDFSQIKKLQFSNGVEYDVSRLKDYNQYYFLKSGLYEASLVKNDGSIVKCEGSHLIDKMYKIRYHSNDASNKVKYSDNLSYGDTVLESNTFTNDGVFEGWAVKSSGGVKYIDKDKITVLPEDTKVERIDGKDVNVIDLYAVWRKKVISVSFDIVYGTEYAQPHATLKAKQLIPASISVEKSSTVSVSAKPASPADRYEGSVSCTNGVEASIIQGSVVTRDGFATRTDTINVTNNSNVETGSVCTIKYTPKWQGIPYGNYVSSDDPIEYGGLKWTFKKDWGNNVGMVSNSKSKYSGDYQKNIYDKVVNATIKGDADNGGLVKQSNGYYITSNGGISKNLDDYNYWTGSDEFYNAADRTHWQGNSSKYLHGFAFSYGGSDSLENETLITSTSSSHTTKKGIVSGTSSYFTISDGKIKFKNANRVKSTVAGEYALWQTEFTLGTAKIADGTVIDSPDSKQLAYTTRISSYDGTDFTLDSSIGVSPVGDTKEMHMFICGGDYSAKEVIFRAKNSTEFSYSNQGTGTGWSKGIAKSFKSNGKYYVTKFAGRAWTCDPDSSLDDPKDCVNNYASDGTLQRVRYYRLNTFTDKKDKKYCGTSKTVYKISDLEKNIYYRPYVRVRER